MAFLSLLGAIVGSAAAAIALLAAREPLPSAPYFVALSVLAIFVGLVAALVPAIAASRRDSLTELRVP
jgi:putative ABC transport system permease protein